MYTILLSLVYIWYFLVAGCDIKEHSFVGSNLLVGTHVLVGSRLLLPNT